MTKAPRSWSCDERNWRECRNAHGCHCAEITALLATRDDWHQAADRARRERDALALQVLTLTNERDNAIARSNQ